MLSLATIFNISSLANCNFFFVIDFVRPNWSIYRSKHLTMNTFTPTPLLSLLRTTFESGKTKDIDFRNHILGLSGSLLMKMSLLSVTHS
jgi:hypothetical protein